MVEKIHKALNEWFTLDNGSWQSYKETPETVFHYDLSQLITAKHEHSQYEHFGSNKNTLKGIAFLQGYLSCCRTNIFLISKRRNHMLSIRGMAWHCTCWDGIHHWIWGKLLIRAGLEEIAFGFSVLMTATSGSHI